MNMEKKKELLDRTIYSRCSVRLFTGDALEEEALRLILKAGSNAPSAHNQRPWRFVAIKSKEAKEALTVGMNQKLRQDMEKAGFSPEAIEEKAERSRRTFLSAGVLLLLFLKRPDRINPLAKSEDTEYLLTVQSVALAGGQMLLAAHELGLGACWYAAPLFCRDFLLEYTGLTPEYEAAGLICVGVPFQEAKKPKERMREPEEDSIIL